MSSLTTAQADEDNGVFGDSVVSSAPIEAITTRITPQPGAQTKNASALSGDWFFELDAQAHLVYSSAHIQNFLGYNPRETLGKPFCSFLAPEQAGRVEGAWERLAASSPDSGGDVRDEWLFLRRDTKQRVRLDVRGVAVFSPDGAFAGVRGVAAWACLTTAHIEQAFVEATETLRETEARLRNADNTHGIAFQFLMRADGTRRLLHISDACRDLFGLSPCEIKAGDDNLFVLYAPEERAQVLRQIRDASRTLTSWDEERAFTHPVTGEARWGRTIARPRRLTNGDTLWNGLLLDVTERKTAETARLASEERTRRILETSLDAVLTIDHHGVLTEWNGQAEAIFGWRRDEVMGRSLAEVVIPIRMHEKHFSGLARYLESGEATIVGRRVEVSALRRDGTEFPAELSVTPLRLDDGSVAFSGFVRDLTETKRLQAQMVQREKLAALGEMVAGVAHEINNPLAAISGMCQILQMHPDPQVVEDGRAIRDMTNRAVRIVRSLKTFGGQQNGERKPRAISDVIQIALDIAHYRLAEGDVETDLVIAPHLPPALMDGNQIEQVLLNLLINAADAVRANVPPGEGRIRIEADLFSAVATSGALRTDGAAAAPLETTESGAPLWIRVRISDNGGGIPDEAMHHIFDPFFTTKDIGEGTGLGLSICHGIVRDHHGLLCADNGPQGEDGLNGAVFTLLLPVA